jgi:hypothetical protein
MREEPLGLRWEDKNTGDRLWAVGWRERAKGKRASKKD